MFVCVPWFNVFTITLQEHSCVPYQYRQSSNHLEKTLDLILTRGTSFNSMIYYRQ